MAARQHTPGPWTYHATAGEHDFIVYPDDPTARERRDVALVRDFHEANARLIAKAPEMLEVLRSFVDTSIFAVPDYDTARALIAEIEGPQ